MACVLLATAVLPALPRAQTPAATNADADAGIDEVSTSWHQKTTFEPTPSMETWTGGEGYRRVASLYSGVTWAPLASIQQDGLRLRVIAGQTYYRYSGADYDPVTAKNFIAQFAGVGRFIDATVGWQFTSGGTTIKVFGGIASLSHAIAPYDPSTRIQGDARGVKGVLEIWHNWSPQHWTSLDLTMQSTYATATAQVRSGWRLDATGFSIGPEAKLVDYSDTNRNVRSTTLNTRFGLFARYQDFEQELTISGGGVRELTMTPGRPLTTTPLFGYAGAQYMRRF